MKKSTQNIAFFAIALLSIVEAVSAGALVSQQTCNNVSHTIDFGGGVELMNVEVEAAGGAGWQLGFVGEINAQAEISLVNANLGAGSSADFSLKVCVDTVELANMLNAGLLTPNQAEVAQLYLGQGSLNQQQQNDLRHSILNYASVTGMNVRAAEAGLRPAASLIDGLYRSVTGELSVIDMVDEGVFISKALVQAIPVPAKLVSRIENIEQTMARRFSQAELGLGEFCDPSVLSSGNAVASVFSGLCGEIAELSNTGRELQNTIQLLGNFGEDVGKELAGLSRTVNRVSSAMGQIGGNVSNAKNKLDVSFSQIQSAVNRVTSVGGSAQNSLQTAGSNLSTAASNIQQTIDVIRTTTVDVIETVVQDIDDVAQALNTLIQPIVTAVQDFPSAVANFFAGLL